MRVYFHVVVVIRAPVSSKPWCLLLQYTLWPRQRPLSLSQTMGNLWSCAQWMIDWRPPFCRFLQTLLRQEHPFNWALNWDRLVPVLETGEASIRFKAQERRNIRSTLVSEYCKAHQAALSPAHECRTQGHSQCQGAILAAPVLQLWYQFCGGVLPTSFFFPVEAIALFLRKMRQTCGSRPIAQANSWISAGPATQWVTHLRWHWIVHRTVKKVRAVSKVIG